MHFNDSWCQQCSPTKILILTTESPALQFQQNPSFLSQIPGSSCLPSLSSSSITHLLNQSPSSLVGPSTQALVRFLACPLNAVQSEQTTKELVAKAQATTKTYKTICHTIAGNIYHWYRALDFTSNNHGKTACRNMKKIAVHKEHKQDLGRYGFRHRLSCVHENSQTGAWKFIHRLAQQSSAFFKVITKTEHVICSCR